MFSSIYIVETCSLVLSVIHCVFLKILKSGSCVTLSTIEKMFGWMYGSTKHVTITFETMACFPFFVVVIFDMSPF